MDQTARLNFVNNDVSNGMFINWRFIDASGPYARSIHDDAAIGQDRFRSISDGPGVRCHPTLPDLIRAEVASPSPDR